MDLYLKKFLRYLKVSSFFWESEVSTLGSSSIFKRQPSCKVSGFYLLKIWNYGQKAIIFFISLIKHIDLRKVDMNLKSCTKEFPGLTNNLVYVSFLYFHSFKSFIFQASTVDSVFSTLGNSSWDNLLPVAKILSSEYF